MSFTPEQIKEIEAAFDSFKTTDLRTGDTDSEMSDWFKRAIIKKLTRPKWGPKEGEYCHWRPSGEVDVFMDDDRDVIHRCYPLTTREAGAEGLIKALQKIVNDGGSDGYFVAQAALDEWFKFRSE